MSHRIRIGLSILGLAALLLSFPAGGQEPGQDPDRKGGGRGGKRFVGKEEPKVDYGPGAPLPEEYTRTLSWRCIGPAAMGGRITALAVCEADPTTYWVATASGGLLKTVNAGMTFDHQFDREATVSIGDVAVAPSDRKIVWVGTGEANPRNSVSYGDGVYKSLDGGKTWTNMGLKKSFQIGKIAIHPTNPDIVYVGAMGRCYGPSEERGLFKTTDGGKTWNKVFYLDAQTGVIDMRLDPTSPETLYAAMWTRQRDEYDNFIGETVPDGFDSYDPTTKWSAKAGIYKSTDGGKNFTKLTKGLPSGKYGRVGLDLYAKNPKTLFAIVDCEKIGMGTPPKKNAANSPSTIGIRGENSEEPLGVKLTAVTPGGPAEAAKLQVDDIVTTFDGKLVDSYATLRDLFQAKKPGDKVKFSYQSGTEKKEGEITVGTTPTKGGGGGGGVQGKGANPNRPFTALYAGQRENVQDQQGPNSHEYGGIYKSTDAGESWTRINSLNPRPMYFSCVRVDPSDDKYLYVTGVSMYKSADGGKTFTPDASRGVHSDQHALWVDPKDGRHLIVGGDGGFHETRDRTANWDHLNHLAIGQFYHVAVSPQKPYYVFGGLQDNGSWGGPSVGQHGGTGPVNEDWLSVGGGDGFVMRVDQTDPDVVYWESQNGNISRINLKTGERGSVRPTRRQAEGKPYRFNWNTPFILSHANQRIVYCAGEYVFRSLDRGAGMKAISPEITRSKRGSATALSESPTNPDILWAGTDDGYVWVTKNGGRDWTNVTEKIGLKKPFCVATIEASRFAEGRAYVCFDAHRSDDDEAYLFATEDFGATWKPLKNNLPTGSSRCLREDLENPNLLFCGTEFSLFASTDRGASWAKANANLPTVAVHEIALHPTAGEAVLATHGRSIWISDITALRQMSTGILKTDKPVLLKPNTVTRLPRKPATGTTNRRFVGENPKPGAQLVYILPKRAEKSSIKIVDTLEGKTISDVKVPGTAGLHRQTWDQTGNGRGVPPGTYRVVLTVDDKEYSQLLKIEGDAAQGGRNAGDDDDDDDKD